MFDNQKIKSNFIIKNRKYDVFGGYLLIVFICFLSCFMKIVLKNNNS